ncbi:MAG: ribonuclease III [Chlamydiales bacterium]
MQKNFPIEIIEKRLKVVFEDSELLFLAFVHRSFWNENQETISDHNERLEFLGDSILNLIITHYLYKTHPTLDEGRLSKLRSQLVDAATCVQYLQHLDVSEYLLLGKGEETNQGKGRESILADLFEAIMGAVYLDRGLEGTSSFFLHHFKEEIDHLIESPQRNWKAEFQDWAQKQFQTTPRYEIIEEQGLSHHKLFRVGLWVGMKKQAEGTGFSKKAAQVEAAKNALLEIEKHRQHL